MNFRMHPVYNLPKLGTAPASLHMIYTLRINGTLKA